MKRLLTSAAALMMAAALVTVGAGAESSWQKKRKKGFFEDLFGVAEPRGSEPARKREIRIIRGDNNDPFRSKKARRSAQPPVDVANDDPEPAPGQGMGNIPYVPPPVVALAVPGLEKGPVVYGLQQSAVRRVLSDDATGIKVSKESRDAIVAHYRGNDFKPVWLDGAGRPSERALKVLDVLASAAEEGLDPVSYLPPVLTSYSGIGAQLPADRATMATFDVGLTAMALKYASHASGGQFEPNRLSLYHDLAPQTADPAAALKVFAWSPFPADYLRSLQPSHPAYAAFKKALADLRREAEEEPATPIAEGNRIKRGQSDGRIPAVRARLVALGFLTGAEGLEKPETRTMLDPALSQALKEFQRASGIKATGNLDGATVAAFNQRDGAKSADRIAFNMDRLRWLPRNLGSRHVFVNQAAFEVRVYDGGDLAWQSKVIVGKPNTQTAAFQDQIETVVFNPSWGVPPSIVANEYMPKLRRDPSYLDRKGFKVVDRNGRVVRSSSVNWNAYGKAPPFSIQQPPGSDNALGELKFLFPNSHHIYMHDTPTRNLFGEQSRAFSHGCVRVENPREFAAILLGWDGKRVDRTTDSRKSQTVRLKSPVPVYLTYFTAWPDEDGKIRFFNDIYGRDSAMDRAVSATTIAQR